MSVCNVITLFKLSTYMYAQNSCFGTTCCRQFMIYEQNWLSYSTYLPTSRYAPKSCAYYNFLKAWWQPLITFASPEHSACSDVKMVFIKKDPKRWRTKTDDNMTCSRLICIGEHGMGHCLPCWPSQQWLVNLHHLIPTMVTKIQENSHTSKTYILENCFSYLQISMITMFQKY